VQLRLTRYSVGNAFWQTDADTFVPRLISRLGSLIQGLYDSGARKFLVLNVPPTGRSPLFLDQGDATVKQHAAYLSMYNTQLKDMVDGFKANHTDVSFPNAIAR
jgi:phospholipase/lecithinase/hemolysin